MHGERYVSFPHLPEILVFSWILHCTNRFKFPIFRRNVVFLSLRLSTKTGLFRPENEGIKIIRNFGKYLQHPCTCLKIKRSIQDGFSIQQRRCRNLISHTEV